MSWTTAQLNAAKRGHQTEHDMQVHCVRWFRQKYPRFERLLFAIPNGADLGGATPIARAKNWQKLVLLGFFRGGFARSGFQSLHPFRRIGEAVPSGVTQRVNSREQA